MTISNTRNIVVSGKKCVSDAIIISNFTEKTRFGDRTLTMTISNKQGKFTIYCTAGDTCIVYCVSRQSCTTIDLYCEGICNIHDLKGT